MSRARPYRNYVIGYIDKWRRFSGRVREDKLLCTCDGIISNLIEVILYINLLGTQAFRDRTVRDKICLRLHIYISNQILIYLVTKSPSHELSVSEFAISSRIY